MLLNKSPLNKAALNGGSSSTFSGVFGQFQQSVTSVRDAGSFISLCQNVGIVYTDPVFIIFDQDVQLRHVIENGPLVSFNQDVQHSSDAQDMIILNQKVII